MGNYKIVKEAISFELANFLYNIIFLFVGNLCTEPPNQRGTGPSITKLKRQRHCQRPGD